MDSYFERSGSSTPVVSFEEYSETNDAQKVKLLRSQLAIVDRAIGIIGSQSHVEQASEGTGRLPPNISGGSIGPTKRSIQEPAVDTSFKIDTMSSQLATCPQCLAEMDVKKMRSHLSSSCPNKLITCPELNCGCQMPLKHLRKHLALECEITMKRRKLVAEAEQRKEMDAQRLLDEADERRRNRAAEALALTVAAQQAAESAAAIPSRPGTTASQASAAGSALGDDFLDDLDSRYTICSQCGESMRQSQLSVHLAKKCTHRRIMCPNYHSGCKQGLVPLYLLQVHLSSECAAEKHREAMITRSIHRQEIVKCPACGELVSLMNLRKHEKELCANRRVPCRNHALGCTVMVRLRERALHELVDGNKALRPALYMPSHGAHLAIREDDIPCPWTAEYWIYRPPARESLKGHLRNIFLLLPKYNVAFAAEVCVKEQVMRLVRALKNSSATSDPSADAAAAKLSKEQRVVRARELAQQRMDMVNALSALVPLYTEAVLAYTRAFQELAVSVEAGCQCAQEVTSEIGFRDTERSTLQVLYPGEIAAPPGNKLSFGAAKKRKDEDGTGTDSKKGSVKSKVSSGSSAVSVGSTHSAHSEQQSQSKQSQGGGSNASSQHKGADGEEGEGEGGDPYDDLMFDDADMLGAEGDGDGDGEGDEGPEEEGFGEEDSWGGDGQDPGEGQDQEGAAGADGGTTATGSVANDAGSALSGATGRRSNASSSVQGQGVGGKGRKGPVVDFDAIATYIKSGSSLASVFKACLHLENSKILYEVERRYFAGLALVSNDFMDSLQLSGEAEVDAGGEEQGGASQVSLLHPDLDLEYLLPPPAPAPHPAHRDDSSSAGHSGSHLQSQGSAASIASSAQHTVAKIPAASISRAVLKLQEQGISGFLADMLVAPKKAAKSRALLWGTWQSLLQLLRKGLKTDFDALQEWRVGAGLLKPDASRGAAGGKGGKTELTAKQEKAQEKKEKARLKREMKKQEKLRAHEGADGAVDTATATATATGTSVSVSSVISKKDDGLFKRVGELLKGGCGAGVLAESTCVSKNEVSGHSKICLSLDSGLSLLLPYQTEESPQRPLSRQSNGSGRGGTTTGGAESDPEHDDGGEGEGDHEDHHYDLLLRPQDMSRLVRCSGKIGIVTIPHSLGETTGLGDFQLQQLAQQEAAAAAAAEAAGRWAGSPAKKLRGGGTTTGSIESPPSSPGSQTSAGSIKAKPSKKRTAGGADGSAGAATAKKASSMVRLGMESRSFEVAVPRGKWTHIALVATALPQNKLTLYMDGLLVKTLKDCAFPLPMNALGGCTQGFESFDGALLDVRYWGVQRSSVQIVDNMHKLLDLEVDGVPNLTGNSQGLVAWWTFEDGGGKVSVTDVTGHRFKTLIERRQAAISGPAAAKAGVAMPVTATATRATTPTGKQRGAVENEKEGFFTQEEGARPGLPEEVRRMLPAPFLKLLPPHGAQNTTTAEAAAEMTGVRAETVVDGPAVGSSSAPCPWDSWLSTMPKWNWLDAETLPVPKALNMPSSALGPAGSPNKARSAAKQPPQLPKSPAAVGNSKGHNSTSSSPDKQQHPVPQDSAAENKGANKGDRAGNRSLLPVPSLRARGVCPYELRRHRLATSGRELQREVDCPLGCEEKVRMVEVRFHVRYVCTKRLVACRFDYCSAVFPLYQREAHEHSDCKHFYAREQVLSLAELHTTMFPCSLCSESVMQRDMATHEQHECPHRLVPCRYADCTMGREPSMEAHLLTYHLRFQCDSPTRKERFMLVERARARLKYPRPWGFDVPLEDAASAVQNESPTEESKIA